jgi:hypothetical protein
VLVTARSQRETHDEPETSCEWSLQEIAIRRDVSGTPDYLTAPSWLTTLIEESEKLAEAVAERERHAPPANVWRDPAKGVWKNESGSDN